MSDLRAAPRRLHKRPGVSFGIVAVLTVALGATTAMLSIAYAYLVE